MSFWNTAQTALSGDFSSPILLAAIGVLAGGLALLINTMMSLTSRIRNAALLLFGTAGAGGATLINEDIRSGLLSLLGIG